MNEPAPTGGHRESARFRRAIERFDGIHALDPEELPRGDVSAPRALVLHERLSAWVRELELQPSEALELAARCQHLRRWEVPRSSYPQGRRGYLQWRKDLTRFHADKAAEVLTEVGYGSTTLAEVRAINLKQGLGHPGDAQTMEDALCLAFLQLEARAFAGQHDEARILEIVRKTWAKMSPRGQQAARTAPVPEAVSRLLERALSTG